MFLNSIGIRDVRSISNIREITMKAEFTAIIEAAPEGGFWAICPEVPGANGQGETIEAAKDSLRQAIELILEDRKADVLRGLPEDAIRDTVTVGWNDAILSEGWELPDAILNGKEHPIHFGLIQEMGQ